MNKKISIIIIVVLLAFSGLLLLLFKNDEEEEAKTDIKYLMVDNISVWSNSGNTWSKSNSDQISENDLYAIYVNQNYMGNYYLKYGNSWNLFDSNNKFIKYDGSFLAHSLDLNINVNNFINQEINEDDLLEISNILNFSINRNDLSLNEKVVIDLDGNGIIDKIINVSNLDSENQMQYFYLMYIVLNNKIYILINDNVPRTDVLKYPIYEIKYLLNINNETHKSIIVQKGYFSEVGETGNLMFQFKDNKYMKVIED